jgi:hypothetical protein
VRLSLLRFEAALLGCVLPQRWALLQTHRRAAGQTGYQLLAVEHMPEQSLGCVAEANAVALYLRNTLGVTAPIVFTGMSFGGAMAGVWPGVSNANTCMQN